MAQYSINAYDADVYIPEFRGLMQYGDQMGGDLRFSPDCMNIETPAGVLQPVCKQEGAYLKGYNPRVFGTAKYLVKDNGTLMVVRMQATDESTAYLNVGGATASAFSGGPYDVYIYMDGSTPYQLKVAGDVKESGIYTMAESVYPMGSGWDAHWSWVTYEESDDNRTDNILLVSNENRGLFKYGTSGFSEVESAPANFRYIARFAERIWGIAGDTLYYSVPFDATDWAQNDADPAMGGGAIREPTFDDDKIVGMYPLGDALIVFSRKRAWRITGSDPSNFSIQEQLGNGTKYPDTIAVVGERIIMLGDEGLLSYDGYHVAPLMQEATHEIFREIVIGKNNTHPVATRIGNKYVLALNSEIGSQPVLNYGIDETGSITAVQKTVGNGYRTIVYDTFDGTITQMSTPKVISFCEGTPYFIGWFEGKAPEDTDDTHTSHVKLMRMRFDSWYERRVTDAATRWVSPWVTLGRQDVKKGGFDFYFTPEIAPAAVRQQQLWEGGLTEVTIEEQTYTDYENKEIPSLFETEDTTIANTKVTFKISIQTEKKTKTKRYTVNSMTAAQLAADRKYKMKRLHFGGAGRRFRVIIETEAGNTTPWRLVGGIHIIAEIDKD